METWSVFMALSYCRADCPTQVREALQQHGSQVIGWAGSHETLGLSDQTNTLWFPTPGSMLS